MFGNVCRADRLARRTARRGWSALLGVAVLACVLLCARTTSAQSDADREKARSLASEGFEALQREDYSVAEDRLRRADALVHAPTLVVDHARALVGLGRLVEAHERYQQVLREGVAPTAPWQWKRAVDDAEEELAALKPRLAWLTIEIKGLDDPNVLVDSKPVPSAALGVRRATDPGTHAVSVSAPGFAPQEEMVTLDEGQSASLSVELKRSGGLPEIALRTRPGPTEAEPAQQGGSGTKTLAYVALGVGGAGIVLGVITGVIALNTRSDLMASCPDQVCVPETEEERDQQESDISRYRTFGTISGVSFAVGAVAAVTGGTLLFLAGQRAAAGSSAPPLRVGITPNAFDVRIQTAF